MLKPSADGDLGLQLGSDWGCPLGSAEGGDAGCQPRERACGSSGRELEATEWRVPWPRAQAGLLYPLGHHFGARGFQEPRVFESPPGRHKEGEMAALAIVIPFRFLSCEYVSQPRPRLATLRRPHGLLCGLSIKG